MATETFHATTTDETQTAVKTTSKRAPTLPLKYGRFMQFGYFLLDTWCQGMDRATVDANTAKFLDMLRVFDTVDVQAAFYQNFLDHADGIGRTLKTMVQDKKKELTKLAAKSAPKKPRPPRAKKAVAATAPTKRRRGTVIKFVSPEQEFIDELVRLANERVEQLPEVPDPVPQEGGGDPVATVDPTPTKKRPAPRMPTDAEIADMAETGRKKYRAMEAVEVLVDKHCIVEKIHFPPDAPAPAEEEEEEEVVVSRVVLGGKNYLVDDDDNVYDAETHEHVGTRRAGVLVANACSTEPVSQVEPPPKN